MQIQVKDDEVSQCIHYIYNKAGWLVEKKEAIDSKVLGEEKSRTLWAVTRYEYDPNGNLITILTPKGYKIERSYDACDRLISERVMDSENGIDRLTLYTYDAAHQVIKVEEVSQDVASNIRYYSYDLKDRMTHVKANEKVIARYFYNQNDELIKEVSGENYNTALDDGPDTTYGYDLRLSQNVNGKTSTFIYNTKNQLTELHKDLGITNFTYDAQGNILKEISPEGTTSFNYNALNQQIKVATATGNTLVNRYDAENLGTEIEENEKLTRFIFHRDEILVEADENEVPISRLIRGYDVVAGDILVADESDMIADIKSPSRYYYQLDEQFSTSFITNKDGKVENRYTYDAFGNTLENQENIHNRIKYTGQQNDPVTQQYYLRARLYNPILGRFMQEDVYRGDGLNLYAYCRNNPIMYYDPSGYAKNKNSSHPEINKEDTINDQTTNKVTTEVAGVSEVKNWKGETVKIPEGHVMSPRDTGFEEPPIFREGPYTSTQREAFLKGDSAGTKLAPHHRNQIPVRDGGVIDEIPGPGHPEGNVHTRGTPNRHPGKSIFNSEPGGNTLRQSEIKDHWKDKGGRLVEVEPDVWIDPGPSGNK